VENWFWEKNDFDVKLESKWDGVLKGLDEAVFLGWGS